MTYKKYLQYLNDLGLSQKADYDYKDKTRNVNNEIERMLTRSIMMFQWHNLPDTIPQDQLELMLQTQGYAIIGQDNGKLYAFYGSLGGVPNEYYQPTKAIVSNPYLNLNKEFTIGEDCALIKNDVMLQGLLPLYSKYATFESETDISLLMALVNLRVQAYISASDDRAIQSAKTFIDNLYKGDLSVIADDPMLQSLSINTVNKYQDLVQIKEVQQYIRGQLYNEIGLATNYNLKKERVTQAEVELNTDNLYPFVDNMYERRKEGIESVYDLFGASWEVEFSSSWDYRLYNGEPITTKEDKENDDNINGFGNNSGDLDDIVDLPVTADNTGSETKSDESGAEIQDNIDDSITLSDDDINPVDNNTDTDNPNILSDDDPITETEMKVVELIEDLREDNSDDKIE